MVWDEFDSRCWRRSRFAIRAINAIPMPRAWRGGVAALCRRVGFLGPLHYPCPACGRLAWCDCRSIAYPTCGRDECEDAILEESNQYWRELVQREDDRRVKEVAEPEHRTLEYNDDIPF
jgi:hypothetical protein